MTIMAIVFAVIVPQLRPMLSSWDSKAGAAEALQNGRVLADHLHHNLSKAVKITAVSDSATTNGYIEYEDNDGNTCRYDVASSYVEFGVVGDLNDLAGPVSQLQFTCYDACDFNTAITDGNDIRFVQVQTTLTNSAALGQDRTFTAKAYLRTNWETGSGTDPNLVAWWKLNETSGTNASDSSGNGNDGTLTNMVGTEWTTGFIDGGLDFAGDNDYINCGNNSSLQITGDLTIAAWVQLASGNSGAYYGIAGKLTDAGGYAGYALVRHSSNYFRLWVADGSTIEETDSDVTYTDTGWHHVAGVRRDGTNYLYIDGVEQTDTSTRALSESGDYAHIGRQYSSIDDRYFDGIIDDVRIYDRALDVNEIAQLAGNIVTYEEFTEAKASSDVTSITIETPGSAEGVAILGSWTSGLTHTAEAGSNRLLILTAHCEDDDADMDLQSVTYGGQSMTKVIERETQEDIYRAHVVAYILDEAGIAAATGNTFSPTWSSTAEIVAYSSVFLSNVNQTTATGASASNGTNTDTDYTISTSALSTNNGDMVIVAGTAGNTGTYSVNNGFTEAIELSITSSDGIAGYKAADGSDETPSITHSNPYRQVIIGFVVQVGDLEPDISEGDLLIAAVATDGDTSLSLAPPVGEGWTEINLDDYGSAVTLGVWWKLADASESTSHQFTWTGGEQAYGWMMWFTSHDPTTPINTSNAQGGSSLSPDCPSVTTTVASCLILRIGGFDDDDITVDSPGLSGHTAITMDESAASSYSCSGGAGYKLQPAIGASGISEFSLTGLLSEEYRTVTVAIAPDPNAGGSSEEIRP